MIFTAHSLPESYIGDGDHMWGTEATVEALSVLGSLHWHLAYQSKGRGEGTGWDLGGRSAGTDPRAGCRYVGGSSRIYGRTCRSSYDSTMCSGTRPCIGIEFRRDRGINTRRNSLVFGGGNHQAIKAAKAPSLNAGYVLKK